MIHRAFINCNTTNIRLFSIRQTNYVLKMDHLMNCINDNKKNFYKKNFRILYIYVHIMNRHKISKLIVITQKKTKVQSYKPQSLKLFFFRNLVRKGSNSFSRELLYRFTRNEFHNGFTSPYLYFLCEISIIKIKYF